MGISGRNIAGKVPLLIASNFTYFGFSGVWAGATRRCCSSNVDGERSRPSGAVATAKDGFPCLVRSAGLGIVCSSGISHACLALCRNVVERFLEIAKTVDLV